MKTTHKVIEIFDWFNNFNNTNIKISGETKEFVININNNVLPHLLGLQYINNINDSSKRGFRLYQYIKFNHLSDQEIENEIELNYGKQKVNDVANRINTFKEFMENLENGFIYQNTNKYTKLKSNYLIVQTKDNEFLQLGIVQNDIGDSIVDFEVNEVMKNYLETYFTRKDDNYIKHSKIIEKVQSIEKYNEQGELEPFSFCVSETSKELEKGMDNDLNAAKKKILSRRYGRSL